MTATITNLKGTVFGGKRIAEFDVALGSYTGGGTGVSVTPSDVGMTKFDIVIIEPGTDGYAYDYDYTNLSMKAYLAGGASSFSATVSAPGVTVSEGNIAVSGPTGAGIPLQLTNATVSGKISKTAATSRVIPMVTFGIPLASGVLATAPTFSAATAQASLIEVDSATLSTAVHCLAIGN